MEVARVHVAAGGAGAGPVGDTRGLRAPRDCRPCLFGFCCPRKNTETGRARSGRTAEHSAPRGLSRSTRTRDSITPSACHSHC